MNIPGKGRKKERFEEARAKKPTGDRARSHEQLVAWEGGLEKRLQFETLLADISAHFVNLPVGQIDSEIENAQRLVCEFLRLDMSALLQQSAETSDYFTLTHLYRPLGGPSPPERMGAQEYFPWSLQQIMAGKVVAISSLDELPAEASQDRAALNFYGFKTALAIPLLAGDGLPFGFLSFNTALAERAWPEEIVKRLQLITQVFANALARKRQALRESEARLSLAADAAGAGLWIFNVDTGDFWGTEQEMELLGLAPGGKSTFQGLLNVIYPEDRERVRLTVKEAMQSRQDKRVDYRVVLPDGTVRWISCRGRPYFETLWGTNCLMGVSLDITKRKLLEEQLQARLREIEDLKSRLEGEFRSDDLKTAFAIQAGMEMTQQQVHANKEGVAKGEAEDAAIRKLFSELKDYDVKGEATVLFAVNSAKLSEKAKEDLKALAESAKNLKGYLIQVVGYTDSSGSANYNTALSDRRAENVVVYLRQSCGVQISRVLSPAAMGESKPAATNETKQGKAENRRVEVKILLNRGLAQ